MNHPTDDAHVHDAAKVQQELDSLEARINAVLPPRYVGCFEDVPSRSMGSAALKYDQDGKVAWGEIWTTFCHLALAGGPPHRGRFLGACPVKVVLAHPTEQATVVAEIKRAIGLTADLSTCRAAPPGWVGIRCHDEDMAAWLVRAIVAENVIARHEGNLLFVPAGPHFRIEKEVKNVVVCVAKTCHYLLDHVDPRARPRGFSADLVQPHSPEEIASSASQYQAAADELRQQVSTQLGLTTSISESPGWVGMQCANEEMAIWMQRAIVVDNVLVRRELDVLFVPVRLETPANDRVLQTAGNAVRLWRRKAAPAT